MYFSRNVPPKLIEEVPNIRKLVDVLDALSVEKSSIVHSGTQKSFNPVLCDEVSFYRKYLAELGLSFLDSSYFTREIWEKLILNATTFLREKGTRAGTSLLIDCLCNGVVTELSANYLSPKRLMPSDVLFIGSTLDLNGDCFLPDSDMVGMSLVTPKFYPFIFGADDFDYYVISTSITIQSEFTGNTIYENFMRSILPRFLPPIENELTINFI